MTEKKQSNRNANIQTVLVIVAVAIIAMVGLFLTCALKSWGPGWSLGYCP